jgi:RNA polymerase sigma-54 factor
MDLYAGLWQQQSLKLTMTQELSQAIALLQYSGQELTEFLQEKMLENPLLQIRNQKIDLYTPKKRRTADDSTWIEQIGDQRDNLTDHLLPQLYDLQTTPTQKKILTYLINHLDHNGYFTGNIEEIAKKFKETTNEIENCLNLLQQFEPAGIGARSLGECLLLQIQRQNVKLPLAKDILTHHFQWFANKKWSALSKIYSIKIQEIQNLFDFVQTLNPRPGLSFQHEKCPYIIPDVVINQGAEELVVKLYDDLLTKVLFNQTYFQRMAKHHDQKVSEFLQEKRQDFQWIIRSLEQRQNTILNVTKKIVEKQYRYFQKSADFLLPMTMREIAQELGIHESTVSRAVRGKYAQTLFGTVELKSFFTSSIDSESDESLSSSKVKNSIIKLVKEEDKLKPLSDLELVHLLSKQEGIDVSRRTVAKYRDQLSIPSSMKRKRYE